VRLATIPHVGMGLHPGKKPSEGISYTLIRSSQRVERKKERLGGDVVAPDAPKPGGSWWERKNGGSVLVLKKVVPKAEGEEGGNRRTEINPEHASTLRTAALPKSLKRNLDFQNCPWPRVG